MIKLYLSYKMIYKKKSKINLEYNLTQIKKDFRVIFDLFLPKKMQF